MVGRADLLAAILMLAAFRAGERYFTSFILTIAMSGDKLDNNYREKD